MYEKSVTLFLQDEQIQISHLDSVLGLPRKAHEIGDGLVLLTHVAKEGKTIVSDSHDQRRTSWKIPH